jgi:hypothetical protein
LNNFDLDNTLKNFNLWSSPWVNKLPFWHQCYSQNLLAVQHVQIFHSQISEIVINGFFKNINTVSFDKYTIFAVKLFECIEFKWHLLWPKKQKFLWKSNIQLKVTYTSNLIMCEVLKSLLNKVNFYSFISWKTEWEKNNKKESVKIRV